MKENKTIVKQPGDRSKVYSHEPYAQALYDLMFGVTTVSKDLEEGEIIRVSDLRFLSDDEIEIHCENYCTLYFSLQKEKRFLDILGLTSDEFKTWITSGECKEYLDVTKTYVIVENSQTRRGSMYNAHLRVIIDQFKSQIVNPTTAYKAKILSKNQGGFLVEVQGINAFLPGSLAAANKIVNFEEYIGKEVFVMIEDYLQSSDIFVVSYKKYLERILPSKLGELEKNKYVSGIVTGTSKFGIFAEFDELFTGLLHISEMNPQTYEKFTKGQFKSGETLNAWLKDIKDNKLILTEVDPSIKQNEMEEYKMKFESTYKDATIISIKPHGALMEIDKGMIGLLPVKEMKKFNKRLNVGETLNIFIKKIDTETCKIYLTMYDTEQSDNDQ